MLEETCDRLVGLDIGELCLIANDAHRFQVAEVLRCTGFNGQILLEPEGRNTAPAIAVAAFHLLAEKDQTDLPVMLVMPADHQISDNHHFQNQVRQALPLAQEGKLVCFGVTPDRAETGYGYIRSGKTLRNNVAEIVEFVEKPSAKIAEQLISAGQCLWNSGIYLLRADCYLEELQKFSPQMFHACQQAVSLSKRDLDFIRLNADEFNACPSDSIDYAVMEKTSQAAVMPLNCEWSDLGSWAALQRSKAADTNGNVLQGDVMLEAVSNSYIHGGDRLIAAVGVNDLCIVDTEDALLVANREQIHRVKGIVESLIAEERPEYLRHRRVYRPWGSYDLIEQGPGFSVKHISVKSGARLSLQKHQHRAEHWVVVQGVAEVRCGENNLTLQSNQSTYIPKGEMHQLANPGPEPLELIEVQTGELISEEDIERFADDYGRAENI